MHLIFFLRSDSVVFQPNADWSAESKGREVHLGNNHQYLLLCEGKYHPPVLYKTRHGSYRKIVHKLVQVQLSPGQVVVLLPLSPSESTGDTGSEAHPVCRSSAAHQRH